MNNSTSGFQWGIRLEEALAELKHSMSADTEKLLQANRKKTPFALIVETVDRFCRAGRQVPKPAAARPKLCARPTGKSMPSSAGSAGVTTDHHDRKLHKGDASRLEGKKSVIFKTAEAYLGIGPRQRQKLIKSGVLTVEGRGHNRQILVLSLISYVPPREKAN